MIIMIKKQEKTDGTGQRGVDNTLSRIYSAKSVPREDSEVAVRNCSLDLSIFNFSCRSRPA